jgi:hypothetical protein
MTTIADLTQASLEGTGVFDVLMRANKAHLEAEYAKGRIKGPEYATVYLGSLESVMNTALQFLLQKDQADLQAQLIAKQIEKLDKEIDLVVQQTENAAIEAEVLHAQKCKLQAEFDVLVQGRLKTSAEVALLNQKVQTEKAQTVGAGVDADSVIGRQKALYQAQTDGFQRDAEQKTAKLMVDSWNVRRTTDEGTVADATNMLYDPAVGRAVNKLLQGVGA